MKKTTLSPFETARTFYMLRLHDASEHLDTLALLKEVEGKDLPPNLLVQRGFYLGAGP